MFYLKSTIIAFFILTITLFVIHALPLPKYIKPCSRKVADFNKCALEQAKNAIPHLVKGDRRYKIPKMNPMQISMVDLKGINNFQISLKNVTVYGLDEIVPIKFDVDFENQHVSSLATIPRLIIIGEYTMTGKLIFPINGFGRCNITLCDGLYKYEFDWILEDRNNDTYAKIVNSTYDYELDQVFYDFENLFNGDETLSKTLNSVLNENWKIVNEDLQHSVKATLLAIQNSILENLYTIIPYREIFLD